MSLDKRMITRDVPKSTRDTDSDGMNTDVPKSERKSDLFESILSVFFWKKYPSSQSFGR